MTMMWEVNLNYELKNFRSFVKRSNSTSFAMNKVYADRLRLPGCTARGENMRKIVSASMRGARTWRGERGC